MQISHKTAGLPPKQGMYDPAYERDACGMGFVAQAACDGAPALNLLQYLVPLAPCAWAAWRFYRPAPAIGRRLQTLQVTPLEPASA